MGNGEASFRSAFSVALVCLVDCALGCDAKRKQPGGHNEKSCPNILLHFASIDNGIFLLRFRDLGLAIKRLRFRTDGYLIVADNPAIEDEFVSRDQLEGGFIVGRARWIYNKV